MTGMDKLVKLCDEMKAELETMKREVNDAKCKDYGHMHREGKCVYCDLSESV